MHNSSTEVQRWEGKSKGTVLGYRIFVFLMKHLGIRAAYTLLVFVAFYYFLCEWSTNGCMYYYFRHRLGYAPLKAVRSVYESYFSFGQTIIDKIAILAGLEDKFTYEFDGIEYLQALLQAQQGGILISAHIGNFEIAEPFFKKIDLQLQICTVVSDRERSAIKDYLQSISQCRPSQQFIYVQEDMSHIFEINEALQQRKVLCFTGDRYMAGARVLEGSLLGQKAKFPAGPFLIASRHKVPVLWVYVMKERGLHYHLYARVAQTKDRDTQSVLDAYTQQMELMLKKYPLQWFNYFQFWEEN